MVCERDYPLGYKVVENGEIYQAKWYNTGDDPQAQVQYSWQSPWELLGPVVPGEGHAPVIVSAAGSYPAWSQGRVPAGGKVLYQGLPYQAKWSNQGVSPADRDDRPGRVAVEGALQDPWRAAGSPAPQQ